MMKTHNNMPVVLAAVLAAMTVASAAAAANFPVGTHLVKGTGLSLAASPITVGNANAVSSLVLEFVNMQSYTNSAGATVNVPASSTP